MAPTVEGAIVGRWEVWGSSTFSRRCGLFSTDQILLLQEGFSHCLTISRAGHGGRYVEQFQRFPDRHAILPSIPRTGVDIPARGDLKRRMQGHHQERRISGLRLHIRN